MSFAEFRAGRSCREAFGLKGGLNSPVFSDKTGSPMSHSGKSLSEDARQDYRLDVKTLTKRRIVSAMLK